MVVVEIEADLNFALVIVDETDFVCCVIVEPNFVWVAAVASLAVAFVIAVAGSFVVGLGDFATAAAAGAFAIDAIETEAIGENGDYCVHSLWAAYWLLQLHR